MELAADPEDLAIIRKVFGSRAQTLINTLLAFDSYFNWYYPLKESMQHPIIRADSYSGGPCF